MLVDYGIVPKFVVGSPHYLYGKGTDCDHQVELPVREERLSCPLCASEHQFSLLKRIFLAPAMEQVWWSHWNPTTGQEESDRKRMQHHLNEKADRASERLGIAHEFHRNDFTALRQEAERAGKDTQTPLRSTHDRAVKAGTKESKGRFTF
jgi:hypothetical protein